MRAITALAVCSLLFFATAVNAEFYRWVDRDGKENFTDDPTRVPPEYRDQSASPAVRQDRVSVAGKPAAAEAAVSVKERGGNEHRDKNGRGEEWWRRRAENLRRELRDLQDEYDLVLKKEREQEEKQAQAAGRKKKSKTNYDHKKMQLEKKIAQAKRRLEAELPEEARKADAYPGWLRE
jgi:hypothetical protein